VKYLLNGQITMRKLVKAILEDNSEVSFMRCFIFFMIATILCPRTYDALVPKYIFSLRDTSNSTNLDFGSLCIRHLETEIPTNGCVRIHQVHMDWGCLPIMEESTFLVVYFIFGSFNQILYLPSWTLILELIN
jgi:hypothetical protein